MRSMAKLKNLDGKTRPLAGVKAKPCLQPKKPSLATLGKMARVGDPSEEMRAEEQDDGDEDEVEDPSHRRT